MHLTPEETIYLVFLVMNIYL